MSGVVVCVFLLGLGCLVAIGRCSYLVLGSNDTSSLIESNVEINHIDYQFRNLK